VTELKKKVEGVNRAEKNFEQRGEGGGGRQQRIVLLKRIRIIRWSGANSVYEQLSKNAKSYKPNKGEKRL